MLVKGFSFWLAFLQRDLTWGSNVSLLSIWMPRSFSHWLLGMTISPILILLSCPELLKRCDFSGFTFRRVSVNYLNKVFVNFSRSCNTLFKVMLVEWGVLSSAWLVISRSRESWNKSHKNMLNSTGLSMEPCGIPKIISNHELYVPFSFTLCHVLVRYKCNI